MFNHINFTLNGDVKSMRVSHAQRSNPSGRSRSARGTGRGQFQLAKGPAAKSRPEVSRVASVGGVDVIVALQAAGEPSDQRRQAVETSDRILDLLDNLKIAVLSGNVSAGDMNRLKNLIGRQISVDEDPALNDIVKQIDLRARVELAKLTARSR